MVEITRHTRDNWETTFSKQVINLQKEWVTQANRDDHNSGFLATCFHEAEIEDHLKQGATFYLATELATRKIAGFLLLTSKRVFTDQMKEGVGQIELTKDLPDEDLSYLYQAVVTKTLLRTGLGRNLWDHCRKDNPHPIFCDVIVTPIRNMDSVHFFEALGFCLIGSLRLDRYRDFGSLTSHIYLAQT